MKTPGAFYVALELIRNYTGDQPLHLYLKQAFRKKRNYGSRDRKLYADLVFAWHRSGKWMISDPEFKLAVSSLIMGLDLKYGRALSSLEEDLVLGELKKIPVPGRLAWLKQKETDPTLSEVFPALNELSSGFSLEISDFFTLPTTWFRLPDHAILHEYEVYEDELTHWSSMFTHAGTDLYEILGASQPDLVIQDISSQVASALISLQPGNKVWDCCAGSGGKSLFLADRFPGKFQLWASDVRENILKNLQKRFNNRKTSPRVFQFDLMSKQVVPGSCMIEPGSMDLVLADVPCSGSGTWRRNPERLVFFDPSSIEKYAQLQYNIIKNALPALNEDGNLYYMTCSVYARENELNVQRMESELHLKCVEMHFIDKLDVGGDAMFFARLQRV